MKLRITFLLFFLLSQFSCNKDDSVQFKETIYQLSGSVQKGPFAIGSEMNIYELNEDFIPTGRTFHATIENLGYFELLDVSLVSPYVELVADGFYFNEIIGELSSERISLKAIVDLRESTQVNVNILTNLEYERVRYLIKNKKIDIAEAKIKAQSEILNLFKMNEVLIERPEQLDIIKNEKGDAVLLAISSILQGNKTTAELSEIMSEIIYEIKEDGILSDNSIHAELLEQAMALVPDRISDHLKNYYLQNGIAIDDIAEFKNYLNQYISLSGGIPELLFKFPSIFDDKINVLDSSQNVFLPNFDYTVAIDMPNAGTVKVVIRQTAGNGTMGYWDGTEFGWKIDVEDNEYRTLAFNSTLNNEIINDPMFFFGYGEAVVEFYYNESETPSNVKSITWGGYNDSDFYFFNDFDGWTNLLACPNNFVLESGADYSIELSRNDHFEANFVLEYNSETMAIDIINGEGHTYELLDNKININLSGSSIKGIIFHIDGEGIVIISSDLMFRDGTYLERTLTFKKS